MTADRVVGGVLTDAQEYILSMLNPEWEGKADGPTVNVLRSLERKGFAGHTEWPRKCWSITEAGRAALANARGAK
jgi:hypothetical protein